MQKEKVGNVLINVMQDLSRISTNDYARIRLNSNLCEPQTFQTLFEYFSRGTILEHVHLDVESMESQLNCSCGNQQVVKEDHPGYMNCPECGRFAEVKDDSYQMVKPDPEIVGQRNSIRF
ncbi:hydrogenase/urease maturation nickel metallochaperone HypA [Candidatus Nanohalococcus occultus]|uniref:Zn finger protein HypA/HybF n=1 Tax=Candidatus Nanohalococcus occultus TaxID=2978047 RepID=A0ABY8CDE1_9ARCH|nr:Zn finger protein HypA/HybF [Candidatus Nanohaloarchaeota archaeon SVXNc]